jgi:hypothetical protein
MMGDDGELEGQQVVGFKSVLSFCLLDGTVVSASANAFENERH